MVNDSTTGKGKIPVFDINVATFLELNNAPPELTMLGSRVVFEFESSDAVYTLLRAYQSNPSVPILDYVNVLRRLRARMLSMRGER